MKIIGKNGKLSIEMTKEEYVKSCEKWNDRFKNDPENQYDMIEVKSYEKDVIIITENGNDFLMFDEDFWEYIIEFCGYINDEDFEDFIKEIQIK